MGVGESFEEVFDGAVLPLGREGILLEEVCDKVLVSTPQRLCVEAEIRAVVLGGGYLYNGFSIGKER
jgi:hypothetical protein